MRKLFFVFLICGCASNKYEVVQRLGQNSYHTQNIKKKDVIIYKTELKLKPGDIVIIPNKAKKNGN